jgi:hypothetical protein
LGLKLGSVEPPGKSPGICPGLRLITVFVGHNAPAQNASIQALIRGKIATTGLDPTVYPHL